MDALSPRSRARSLAFSPPLSWHVVAEIAFSYRFTLEAITQGLFNVLKIHLYIYKNFATTAFKKKNSYVYIVLKQLNRYHIRIKTTCGGT